MDSLLPVQVLQECEIAPCAPLAGVTGIASGDSHTLVVDVAGNSWEWGLHPTATGNNPTICEGADLWAKTKPAPVAQPATRSAPKLVPLPPPVPPGGVRQSKKCPYYQVDPGTLLYSQSQAANNPLGIYGQVPSQQVRPLLDYWGHAVTLRWGNTAWGKVHIDRNPNHGWGTAGSLSLDDPWYRTKQALEKGSLSGSPVKDRTPNSYDFYYHYIYNSNLCTRLVVISCAVDQNGYVKGIITAKDEGTWTEAAPGAW